MTKQMHKEQDPNNYPSCPYCGRSDNSCDHVFATYEPTFFFLSWGYLKGRTSSTEKELLEYFNGFSRKFGYENGMFKSGNLHLDQIWRHIVMIETKKEIRQWYVPELFVFGHIAWKGLFIRLSGIMPAGGCFEVRSIKFNDVMEVYFSPNPAKTWSKVKVTLKGLLETALNHAEAKYKTNRSKYIERIASWEQIETITQNKRWYINPKTIPKSEKDQKYLKQRTNMPISIDWTDSFDNSDKFNIVDDYVIYRNTRAYIEQKHKVFFGSSEKKEQYKQRHLDFLADYGFFNMDNYLHLLDGWKNLNGMIPWFYFDAINVDPKVLNLVLETDAEEYVNVLRRPIVIDKFIVRYMSAVYVSKAMPPSTEVGAIDYINEFQRNHPFPCCINIRDVKSIFVGLDDTITYTYCYPEFKKTKTCYTFSKSNRDNAITRVSDLE